MDFSKWKKKHRKELRRLEQAVLDAGDRRDWDATNRADDELEKFRKKMGKKYGKKGV